MITPEIISYIKSQLALGITRDSISLNLVRSGWQIHDVEEAFNAVSAPISANPVSQPINQPNSAMPVQTLPITRSGSFIGKFILGMFIAGLLGLMVFGGIAYYAYSKFASLSNSVCADKSITNQAECQQSVKNFFGFLLNMGKNQVLNGNTPNNNIIVPTGNTQENTDCSNGLTDKSGSPGIGDITAIIGINDPVLCHYSQPADLTGISKVTIDISGSGNSSNESDAVKIVAEIDQQKQTQKITTTKKDGGVSTLESATSSALFGGISTMYLDVLRMQIPLLQMCIKSTNWNTNGGWFNCDKITFMGMTTSDSKTNEAGMTAIRLAEINTDSGKALSLETRKVKDGSLSVSSMQVLRDSRLMKYTKNLEVLNYTGTDLMTGKTIEELSAMNPDAKYSDLEFSYEK